MEAQLSEDMMGQFLIGFAGVMIGIGVIACIYEWFQQAASRQQREIDTRRGLWQRHLESLRKP
jgi:hypothetical protein